MTPNCAFAILLSNNLKTTSAFKGYFCGANATFEKSSGHARSFFYPLASVQDLGTIVLMSINRAQAIVTKKVLLAQGLISDCAR